MPSKLAGAGQALPPPSFLFFFVSRACNIMEFFKPVHAQTSEDVFFSCR